jgi:hypothetical protein
MLSALQGSFVLREALASAAVVVWSAAVLPAVPATASGLAFAAGMTQEQLPHDVVAAALAAPGANGGDSSSSSSRAAALLRVWSSSSLLEQQLVQQGTSVVRELQRAPVVARVCGLRGLMTAVPAAALAGDLRLTKQQQQQQQQSQQAHADSIDTPQAAAVSSCGSSFVMHCALPFAVKAVRSAPDAHSKFYAMSLLTAVLGAATQLWGNLEEQQLRITPEPAAAAAAEGYTSAMGSASGPAAPAAAGVAEVTGTAEVHDHPRELLVVPWLSSTDAQAVMSLLLHHLDEPVAQVLAKVQEAFEALLLLIRVQRDTAHKLGPQAPGSTASGSIDASSDGSTSDKPGASPHASPGAAGTATAAAAAGIAAGTAAGTAANTAADPWLDTSGFLRATARSVLEISPSRKGRYHPLTALLPHVGASVLLLLQPSLVADTIEAMQSNLCASAAAGFFKALLLQLRSERPAAAVTQDTATNGLTTAPPAAAGEAAAGGEAGGDSQAGSDRVLLLQHVPCGMQPWCAPWLPELLSALWDQGERVRTFVANYALPMVLQAEPLLLQPMVDIILSAHAADAGSASSSSSSSSSGGGGGRDAAGALVVVLRTARRLQLVGDLDILLPPPQQQQQQGGECAGSDAAAAARLAVSPAGLLLSAVSSSSAALRTEALELVCVSAR